MIKSETFYRLECDAPGCGAELPDGDEHDMSFTTMDYIRELAAEVGDFHVTGWKFDDDAALCPRHQPGFTECPDCDGHGRIRREGPPPGVETWTAPGHYVECERCDSRGYLVPDTTDPGSDRG